MGVLVNQRGAEKEKAAGKTGRLGLLQTLLRSEAIKEGGAEQLPRVMNSLCTSHMTPVSPLEPVAHNGTTAAQGQAAFFKTLTAFNTSSTWPGTLRPRHSAAKTPSGPIKKVLRSMPLTFLPYMILFLTTPNM